MPLKHLKNKLALEKKVICILTPFLVLIVIKDEVEKEVRLPNESTVKRYPS